VQKPKKISTVAEYIEYSNSWNDELRVLAQLINCSELSETLKWGAPCYCLNGKNVVGLMSFSSYFGLWFHRGSQINDHAKVLINAQKGKTKFLRQWRMTNSGDINADLITDYINQSIAIEKAGPLKQAKRNPVTFVIPPELEKIFQEQPDIKRAFAILTPGRQKEYALYINDAKRSETRVRRVEKITPMILNGVGLNDHYK